MQSKNKLSFVEPFDIGEDKAEINTGRKTETLRYFLEMCGKLLETYTDEVETLDILEESGFVTVFELSLRVPADDGSYLHVLLFGHKQETALLDLGISLIEHGPRAEYGGGYQYIAEGLEVRRSSTRVDRSGEEDETDEDSAMAHFSVLDLYAAREELDELSQADDEEQKLVALETWSGLKEDAEFDEWEEEMGIDNQPIDKDELEKVAAILGSVEYFPLRPDTTPDDTVY